MKRFYRIALLLPALLAMMACETEPADEITAQDLATHNRAVGLMGQFKYEDAQRELSRLVRQYPRNPELQVDLAIATLNRQQEGDEEVALKMLGRVLQNEPQHQRAHYCSGLLELNGGHADRALSHFRQVAEADPSDAYTAYYLALSLVQQSQHEASLQWYRQAIDLDAHLRSAYYGAFQILRRLHFTDEAKEMLDLYQRLATNPRARNAEFKYTHMGPKAEIRAMVSAPLEGQPPPSGPLFSERQSLPIEAMKKMPWQSPDRANLTAADIDGDGHLDLLATGVLDNVKHPNAVLLGNEAGGFSLSPDHALAGIRRINAALWEIWTNDGLLDVYLCRRGRNQLWRQKEMGEWEDITDSNTANGDYDTVDGALFDADHDGDLDLFLVNGDGPNELLNNNRDGSFRPLAEEQGIAGRGQGARSILVTDLDRDRDADILIFNDQPPHEIYLNDLLWNYRPAPGFDALRTYPVAAALAGDRDADGQPELYTLSSGGGISSWQPGARNQWSETGLSLVGQEPQEPNPGSVPSLALLDVDGDGVSELLRSTPDGWGVYGFQGDQIRPLAGVRLPACGAGCPLWKIQVKARPSWVWTKTRDSRSGHRVRADIDSSVLQLSGMEEKDKSMRSNASGIGTHLSLRFGSRWAVTDTFRRYTGPGQSLQPLAIGLGGGGKADFVAIEWSDGVFQSELDLKPGKLHSITETQRQLSSCPVLFAWNGERYQFVTDLLGVGGIGFAIGRGQYAQARPWENILLPAGLLKSHGNHYLLKLTEPMEETAYLDSARLIAYDLPPGWQMVLDERMSIDGPEPTGEPRFYRHEMLPSRVLNQQQQEVTATVTSADLKAAPVGDLDPRFIGRLAAEHSLILEFPQPLDGAPGDPLLVIDGWVEYPYSQTMFAAWQAGADYLAPSLDIQDEEGQWASPAGAVRLSGRDAQAYVTATGRSACRRYPIAVAHQPGDLLGPDRCWPMPSPCPT